MQDANVDLWATDEVHFQQHGSRCRMWIPPEIRTRSCCTPPTRKSVGYFGAVRLRDGRFVFRLETGKFNGPSFLQFLQQLRSASRRCPHNRCFDNLQDVIGAVESEFPTWTTRNDVLRRLCAIT
jgi:DDE superfamily endonuclease